MGNLRFGVALALSLLLHGISGWWYSVNLKLARPVSNPVDPSVMQFETVYERTSKAEKVTDTANASSESSESRSLATAHSPAHESRWGGNEFLTVEQVDVPAKPVGEWVIDFSRWPPGRSHSIVIEMWISASGKLVRWEIAGDTPNREIAEQSLRQLDETPINPALVNGKRVASFRRIEIILDIDP